MKIVWDESKRLANLAKHGLDFTDFESSFEGRVVLPARTSKAGRVRYQLIGTMNGRLVVVAIVSPLGTEAISLVSLRPASEQERAIYEQG